MFCSECGAKNEKGAMFCSECGFKFEEEKEVKKSSKKESKKVEEVVNNEPIEPTKKSNAKIIILILLVTVLGVGYKIMSDMTSPSKIADEYINELKRFGHWRDNCCKYEGAVARSFTYLFNQNW